MQVTAGTVGGMPPTFPPAFAAATTAERAVVGGDAHGSIPYMTALCRNAAAAGAKRVWQLGDLGVWPGSGWYLDAIAAAAVGAGVVIEFLEGNHDDLDQLAVALSGGTDEDGAVTLRPGLRWWPRGSVVDVAGARVGFLGGAISIDRATRLPGRDWWPGEIPTRADVERLVAGAGDRGLDVLLTHDCPRGAGVEPEFELRSSAMQAECDAVRDLLREAVERTGAQLSIHGHWHQRATAHVELTTGAYCRIESLGAEGDDSWVVLELPSVTLYDPCARV